MDDRRSFLKTLAAGIAMVASGLAPLIARASTPIDRRFAEVAQLVADFEKYEVIVLLHNGETMFGNPRGMGREPLSLWYRYRACDQEVFDEYLHVSGRVEGTRHG